MIKGPNLTPEQLERKALELLAEYAVTSGAPVPIVVPVDEIALYHLTLQIKFADLHEKLDIPRRDVSADILGAMDFEGETIWIDKGLDPETYPERFGRYRFSLGHEICHGWLHRSAYFKSQARQGAKAGASRRVVNTGASIVCRDGNGKKPPIEWQADDFSSFLLLPRARVIEAFGDRPPFVFDAQKHGSLELKRLWRSLKPDPDIARTMYASECEQEFELFSQPLAKLFQVSNQVMRIRMEGMGLLKRVRNTALQAA